MVPCDASPQEILTELSFAHLFYMPHAEGSVWLLFCSFPKVPGMERRQLNGTWFLLLALPGHVLGLFKTLYCSSLETGAAGKSFTGTTSAYRSLLQPTKVTVASHVCLEL